MTVAGYTHSTGALFLLPEGAKMGKDARWLKMFLCFSQTY